MCVCVAVPGIPMHSKGLIPHISIDCKHKSRNATLKLKLKMNIKWMNMTHTHTHSVEKVKKEYKYERASKRMSRLWDMQSIICNILAFFKKIEEENENYT